LHNETSGGSESGDDPAMGFNRRKLEDQRRKRSLANF
jgi:hypothetical protein